MAFGERLSKKGDKQMKYYRRFVEIIHSFVIISEPEQGHFDRQFLTNDLSLGSHRVLCFVSLRGSIWSFFDLILFSCNSIPSQCRPSVASVL